MASRVNGKTSVDNQSERDQAAPFDLLFDPQNPHIVEFADAERMTQAELAKVLWENMSIDELMMSIAAGGYFTYEPLIVTRSGGDATVIEGNRRLAALKFLLDPDLCKQVGVAKVPTLSPERRQELKKVPVVWTTRKKAWQYIGFKHVNGPVKWDSYPKAQYIARIKNEFGVPLDEIADQIGDRHGTVQRLYRALMVIEQAESEGVFERERRYKGHFSFSHLYTGLDYEGISSFIELSAASSETKDPVPKKNLKELGELCVWLYGDRTLDRLPIVQSQNPHLRQLDEVVRSKSALMALREGMPLSIALEVSYGDETVFRRSLVQAKDALQKGRATLSTGFDGNPDLLDLAHQIADLSYDLSEEMERKVTRRKRRRRAGRED
ncbi:MAG: hypothetical protein GKR94_21075 [Gammaproteobacteria bacterium]|nr:hypothetical protein [Gammaproteobacteria bacterium]